MTKAQVAAVLTTLGVAPDSLIDFEATKLRYINISKFENSRIDPKERQFYFDDVNEILEVYPCEKKEGAQIKYLLDDSGNKICDFYSYDSILYFVFEY